MKTIMNYHFSLNPLAKREKKKKRSQGLLILSVGKDVEEGKRLCGTGGNVNWFNSVQNTIWQNLVS